MEHQHTPDMAPNVMVPGGEEPPGAGAAEAGDGSVSAGERVEHDIEALLAKARQADEYLALAQRTQADFENYRKRMAREAAVASDKGIGRVATELLPALDHLELALQAAEEGGGDAGMLQGIRLVQGEFLRALARVGVEPFSPRGEQFDPNQHEAMAQQPFEGAASGTVADVYQQGYRLNGNVLRPARVIVAA